MTATSNAEPPPSPPERRFWDRISPWYRLQHRLEAPAIRAAVDLAALTPHDRMLDAGTGTAAVLKEIARRGIHPARVIGIDTSRRMLERAAPLPEGWTLTFGDATDLTFSDASFDVVIASYLLHLMNPSDLASATTEFARILAPGGRLITVTPASSRTLAGRLYTRAIDLVERASGELSKTLRECDPSDPLKQAGFEIRDSRIVESGYRSLCLLATLPAGR